MNGPDREDASFDPRTWGDGEAGPSPTEVAADKAPKPAGDTTSFDPRAWATEQSDVPPPAAKVRTKAKAKVEAPAVAPPKAPGDTTSFDPRAWAADGSDVPPPEPPPAASPTSPTSGRGVMIGAGAAVAAVAVAGFTLLDWRSNPSAVPTPVASMPTAVTGAPPPAKQASRRTLMVAGPADIGPTLTAAGVPAGVAGKAAAAATAALGAAPGEIRMEFDLVGTGAATTLTRLAATRADGAGLILTAATEGTFATEKLQAKLTSTIEVVRGEMDGDSFYSSAVAAGVDDSLIDGFANAFTFDFNFATDISAGDIFEAAFERKVNPSGQAVGKPELLYVSMTTAKKSRALYRFLAPGEKEAGWFDANGRSTVRALMRTPINGARITSNFGPRFHPVLHYTRLHGGTDFAAPVGTPIYAAAAGVVTGATPTACGGNMVVLKHDNGWETRYFHSSRYAEGTVAGARVTQGQTVSYVGNTGTCTTGPHLHYEVHIDGQKVDPMSIDTGSGVSLAGGGLAAFRKERDRIDQSRAAAAN